MKASCLDGLTSAAAHFSHLSWPAGRGKGCGPAGALLRRCRAVPRRAAPRCLPWGRDGREVACPSGGGLVARVLRTAEASGTEARRRSATGGKRPLEGGP